jgi:hypothetical protein
MDGKGRPDHNDAITAADQNDPLKAIGWATGRAWDPPVEIVQNLATL